MKQGQELDRNSKLKLIKAYQRASDIISFGKNLSNLAPGKDGGQFSGQFREVGDSLYGHFIFKKDSFVQKLGFKPIVNHYEIVISDNQFLSSSYYNSPGQLSNAWTFDSTNTFNDSFEALQNFLNWAGKTDPHFDKKLQDAINSEIKTSSKITIVTNQKTNGDNDHIKSLTSEFVKAGKIIITETRNHGSYDPIITARINKTNPLTKDDLTALTDCGAMVITVSYKTAKPS